MDFEQILSEMGAMGPYQWLVIFLVAFGDIAFLLGNVCLMDFGELPACNETETNCTVFKSVVNEWGLEELTFLPNLFNSLTMAGFVVGALCAGHFSDLYGRKRVWLLCGVGLGLVGGGSGLSNSWQLLLVLRFFVGLFVSAYSTSVTTYSAELTSSIHRLVMIVNFLLSYELGFVWLGLVADWTRDWRLLTLCLNVGTVPLVLGVAFLVVESPKWLYQRQRTAEANRSVNTIAKWNRRAFRIPNDSDPMDHSMKSNRSAELSTNQIELSNSRKSDSSKSEIIIPGKVADSNPKVPNPQRSKSLEAAAKVGWRDLFRRKNLRFLCPCVLYCFGAYCIYYGFIFNVGHFAGTDRFLNVIIFGLVKIIPGGGLLLINHFRQLPRRLLLLVSTVGAVVCLSVIAGLVAGGLKETLPPLITGFAVTGSCFAFTGVVVAILYPAELFPTLIRNRACGVSATAARIGGVVAPLLLYSRTVWPALPDLLFATIILISGTASLLLLPETLHRPLPE